MRRLMLFSAVVVVAVGLGVTWVIEEEKNAVDIQNNARIDSSAVHSDSWAYVQSTEGVTDDIPDNPVRGDAGNDADYVELDLWDMGLQWYGISNEDTNRALRLITYEGYGYSPLSYYVACCCWVRATEGYWGYGNLFSAFGEADAVENGGQYGLWMDDLAIADWAYDALDECYRNPEYIRYVNGVIEPEDYIYCEFDGSYWIYVWN